MKTVHPKVVATGIAGAIAIVAAEVGDALGLHPRSPGLYTAIGAIVAFLAGYLKKG